MGVIGPLTKTKRSPVRKLVRPPDSSLALVYLTLDIGTKPLLEKHQSRYWRRKEEGLLWSPVPHFQMGLSKGWGFYQIVELVYPTEAGCL